MAEKNRSSSSSSLIAGDDCSVEDLNLSFDDIDESALMQNLQQQQQQEHASSSSTVDCSVVKKKGCSSSLGDDDDDEGFDPNNYILGTLVVRVVAARNLEAVHKGGLGDIFFGGAGKQKAGGGGASNPYASVRFGNTTQRTSECLGTTEPIWPRGEAMYMDVTHAPWEQVLPENNNNADSEGTTNPGDPPSKQKAPPPSTAGLPPAKPAVSKHHNTVSTVSPVNLNIPKPVLTVAVFHASEAGGFHKAFHSKHGDSDDIFLGMTSVDVTAIITGKQSGFDQWLPLQGSNSNKAAIRVVCEYETSDAAPKPGDTVKFTDFCAPVDLYPAVPGRYYSVHEVEGDDVLISWTSNEGWVSTFRVHRFMLICVNRHHSVVDLCQDELASIRERIAYSPMIHAVQETVERVPDEGLLAVGEEALQNGLSLLNRWWDGGMEATANDLNFAINWDGRHNPSTTASLATTSLDTDTDEAVIEPTGMSPTKVDAPDLSDASRLSFDAPALPNMPACPITGEPMRDPVVAADGHTYERSAIARWLLQSDKSPLTGSVLSHKDLVPNYMLLSSLQEAASSSSSLKSEPAVLDAEEEDETAEVNIDD